MESDTSLTKEKTVASTKTEDLIETKESGKHEIPASETEDLEKEKKSVDISQRDSLDTSDGAVETEVSPGTHMRHIVEDIEAKVESISKHLDQVTDEETIESDKKMNTFDESETAEVVSQEEKRRSVRELVQQHESLVSQSSIEKDKQKDVKRVTFDDETEDKAARDDVEQHALYEIEVTNYEVVETFEKMEVDKVSEEIPWQPEPIDALIEEEQKNKQETCQYTEIEEEDWEIVDRVESLDSEEPCKLPSPTEQEYPVCSAAERQLSDPDRSPEELPAVEIEQIQDRYETERRHEQFVNESANTDDTDVVTTFEEMHGIVKLESEQVGLQHAKENEQRIKLSEVEYQSEEMVECEELESESLEQLSKDYQKAKVTFIPEIEDLPSETDELFSQTIDKKEAEAAHQTVADTVTEPISTIDQAKIDTKEDLESQLQHVPETYSDVEVDIKKDTQSLSKVKTEDTEPQGEDFEFQDIVRDRGQEREAESPVSDEDLVEKPTHVSRESSLDTEEVLKTSVEVEESYSVDIGLSESVSFEDDKYEGDDDLAVIDDKIGSRMKKQKVLLSRQESNIEITLDECGEQEVESDTQETDDLTGRVNADGTEITISKTESVDKREMEETCKRDETELDTIEGEKYVENNLKGEISESYVPDEETEGKKVQDKEPENFSYETTKTQDGIVSAESIEEEPMEETQLHGHVYSDILLAADEEMTGEPLDFSVEPSSDNENEYIEKQDSVDSERFEKQDASVKFSLDDEKETAKDNENFCEGPTAKVIEIIEGEESEEIVPASPSVISETVEFDTSDMLKETTSDYDLALNYVDRVEHNVETVRKPSLTTQKSDQTEKETDRLEKYDVKEILSEEQTDSQEDIKHVSGIEQFIETYIDRTEHFLELIRDGVEFHDDRHLKPHLKSDFPNRDTDKSTEPSFGGPSSFTELDDSSRLSSGEGLKDQEKLESESIEDEEINSLLEQKSKDSVEPEQHSIKSSERPLSPSDYTLEMEMEESAVRDASGYVDEEDYDEEDNEDDQNDEYACDADDPMSADVSQQIFIEQTIEQQKVTNLRQPCDGVEKTEEVPPSPSEYTLVTSYEQEKLKQVLETPEKKSPQIVRIAREEGLSVSMDESVLNKELGVESERNVMSASYDEEAIKYVYDEEDVMVSSVEHVMQDSLIASSIEPDEVRMTGSVGSGREDDISSSEHKSMTDSYDQDSLQKSFGSAKESGMADSMDPDMLQKALGKESDIMSSSMDQEALQMLEESARDDLMSSSMEPESLRRSFGLDQQEEMTDSLEHEQLQRCLGVVTEEAPLTTSLDDELMEKTLGFGKEHMESSDEQGGLKVAVGVDKTADIMATSLEFDDLDALHRSLGLAPSESIDTSSKASEATQEPESNTEMSDGMMESMDDEAFRISLGLKREDPMAMSMDSESLTKSLEMDQKTQMTTSMDHEAMKASLGLDKISSSSDDDSDLTKLKKTGQIDPMMMSMDENALQTSLGLDRIEEQYTEYAESESKVELDQINEENETKLETTTDTVTTEDTNAMRESLEDYLEDDLDRTTNGDTGDTAPALHDTGICEFLVLYSV